MVWLAVAVLPQLSVAVQIRISSIPSAQLSPLVVSVIERATLSSQLSMATGSSSPGSSSQLIVRLVGTLAKVGSLESITFTA